MTTRTEWNYWTRDDVDAGPECDLATDILRKALRRMDTLGYPPAPVVESTWGQRNETAIPIHDRDRLKAHARTTMRRWVWPEETIRHALVLPNEALAALVNVNLDDYRIT